MCLYAYLIVYVYDMYMVNYMVCIHTNLVFIYISFDIINRHNLILLHNLTFIPIFYKYLSIYGKLLIPASFLTAVLF